MSSLSCTHKFANKSRSPLSTTTLTRHSPLNLLIQLYAVRSVQIPVFSSSKPKLKNKERSCVSHYDKNRRWPA